MQKDGKKLNLNIKSPNLGKVSLVSKEQESSIKKEKISFSFLYYSQIDNFGIGNCSQKWYVGFLERLSTLGDMTLNEILSENAGSKSLRCHPIDWKAKNIPIRKEDLDWLPEDVLSNEEETPIMQLSISQATGRIVGFFNQNSSVFHVVLLDPNHNIQPSKKKGYQIQQTTNGISQFDELLSKMGNIKKIVKDCKVGSCPLHSRMEEIEAVYDNIIYTGLDNNDMEQYATIIEKYSMQDIFDSGCISLME